MTGSGVIEVVTRAPGVLLVRVRGSVDLHAVRRLRDEVERLLGRAGRPVRALEIDLSTVDQCDFRLLSVLDDVSRRLHANRSRFAVSGLNSTALGSFTDAGLRDLFLAYRASIDITRTVWPGEPGGGRVRGTFSAADGRLAQMCLDLADVPRPPGGGVDVAAVTGRLVDLCVHWFGVDAAVVLVGPERAPARWAVMAASTEGARLLAAAGLATEQGPVADCLHHGGPVSVTDLADHAESWTQYADSARRHGIRAVRALPFRPSGAADDEPSGALVLFSSVAGPMAAADLVVAQAFADLTALALGTARGPAAAPPGVLATGPEDRILIEQAVGVVSETERISPDAARDLLAGYARSRDLHLAEVARAILADAAAAPTTNTPSPVPRAAPRTPR